MMLNIFIVLVMFIPFYVSIAYKHSTWVTSVLIFLWCSCTSSIMISLVILAVIQKITIGIPSSTIMVIILWGVVNKYFALKVVFSDKPRPNTIK